jgi:outer membrane protein TolC
MYDGYHLGEITKATYDKARIYKINLQNELKRIIYDIQIQKDQLKHLNGGILLNDLIFKYPSSWILPDLDSIIMNLSIQNSELRIAGLSMDENEKLIRFEKMNNLPSFEAGYKSEKILNQEFRGVHAGITIPLWQNNNRIKHAKLQSEWSEAYYQQKQHEIESQVSTLYNQAQTLYSNYMQMKDILREERITESSLELLQSGQISFPEYLVEVRFLIATHMDVLEKEQEYYNSLSTLKLISNF